MLALTGVSRPRVLFVPTASGDSEAYRARFYAAFPPERARAQAAAAYTNRRTALRARHSGCVRGTAVATAV